MRIAIDIDSTLHHYWDQFSGAGRQRASGSILPVRGAVDVGHHAAQARAGPSAASRETHGDDAIPAADPYPGAVEAVNRWHDAGHFIHITSHR